MTDKQTYSVPKIVSTVATGDKYKSSYIKPITLISHTCMRADKSTYVLDGPQDPAYEHAYKNKRQLLIVDIAAIPTFRAQCR